MKKLLVIIGIVGLIAVCARAANKEGFTKSFYRAGEFSVSAFGGVTSPDLDAETTHVGIGADFFLTENLGIGALSSFEDTKGSLVDNVSLRALFRAPIGRYAFGAFAGATRQLKAGEWSINLGPTFEVRLTEHLGWITEIGMDKRLTGDREVSAVARTGIRFAF